MTLADDLQDVLEAYQADDQAFRVANGQVAYWDALQALTQAKKDEHQSRINAALTTRAGQDDQNHAALAAQIQQAGDLEVAKNTAQQQLAACQAELATMTADRDAKAGEIAQLQATIADLEAQIQALSNPGRVGGFDPSKVDWEQPAWTANLTTHGQVLENRLIHGKISLTAEDPVLVNCKVIDRQMPGTGDLSLITAYASTCKRLHMEDCLVVAETPSLRWADGVRYRDGVLIRVDVVGTIDGFGWYAPGGAVNAEQIDCTATGLSWFAEDGVHSDGTHNDGVQCHSPVAHGLVAGGFYDVGDMGTSGWLCGAAVAIDDLVITRAGFRGGKPLAGGAGVNIGSPVTALTNSATTHCVFDNPKNVYCPTALRAGMVLRGNTRPDGTAWNTY